MTKEKRNRNKVAQLLILYYIGGYVFEGYIFDLSDNLNWDSFLRDLAYLGCLPSLCLNTNA